MTADQSTRAENASFPDSLLEGYGRYREKGYVRFREDYERLAIYGQTPDVMVVSCCDSRVTPEGIFGAGPGELFVVRNVANLVPPYEPDGYYHSTSAALEFAVQALKVKHIVVMGHGRCGGVSAFLNQNAVPLSPGDFIGKWMTLLEPAADTLACLEIGKEDDRQLAMEYAGVRQSLANLRTFPCVNILEDKGRLALHGAWFDIGSGELRLMNPETGEFHLAPTGKAGDAG
ncbi:carbonic anhydrase [Stappia sp. F7233]|uniref:Carbonic anhydrase n=1 Tax=Stappia albiluteola TaxID=2758565 RepID=A0A839AI96_9HYPH|nr:carbonic anhydrase [Stappia albiluteola]MBA5778467.1 carbonic anhydrase [Stappia albiluteola]